MHLSIHCRPHGTHDDRDEDTIFLSKDDCTLLSATLDLAAFIPFSRVEKVARLRHIAAFLKRGTR